MRNRYKFTPANRQPMRRGDELIAAHRPQRAPLSRVLRLTIGAPAELSLLGLRFYQIAGAPLKAAIFGQAACCRFHPTCSDYARQAIRRHGALVGAVLTFARLMKCQPFHPGGFDPPPDRVWKYHAKERRVAAGSETKTIRGKSNATVVN